MDRHELAVDPDATSATSSLRRRRQTSKAEFIRELLSQACNEGEKK